jgi:molecular chaperone GrpE (heat shock protein)
MHRALMQQDSDEVEPGRILLVAVPGYLLHDRLLREAQVIVARAPDRAET